MRCRFYKTSSEPLPSGTKGGQLADLQTIERRWCEFTHSPLERWVVQQAPQLSERLTCGADFARCQVDPSVQPRPEDC